MTAASTSTACSPTRSCWRNGVQRSQPSPPRTRAAPSRWRSTFARTRQRRMSYVLVDKPRPHVTLITLNRPERMNAMAFDVMIPLRERIEEVSVDNDTRVVVLTGAGTGFCSGADLEDPGTMPDIDGLTIPTIALRALGIL